MSNPKLSKHLHTSFAVATSRGPSVYRDQMAVSTTNWARTGRGWTSARSAQSPETRRTLCKNAARCTMPTCWDPT